MSYILDSLRKSEQDRQLAAGQVVSMHYPMQDRQRRRPTVVPVLLLGLAAVGAVLVLWQWPARNETPASTPKRIDEQQVVHLSDPVTSTDAGPATELTETAIAIRDTIPLPAPAPEPVPEATPAPKKVVTTPPSRSDSRKPSAKPAPSPQVATAAVAASSKSRPADPLSEIPQLTISGYIHNEDGGSLALINDRLVGEGEEISPGLRLIEIRGNAVKLDYKGYQFIRKQ